MSAAFVLLPGAGGESWYWHLVAPRLRECGHEVVSPDLPAGDESAGLSEYADAVVEAVGDRGELTVVAQSMRMRPGVASRARPTSRSATRGRWTRGRTSRRG